MVRNCNNVSICIWYEMVIMYRSAYGTKWQWYEMVMVRKWFSLWYEMAGTKWLWYEMTIIHKNHAPFKLNGQSRTAFGLLKAPELQRLSVTVEVLRVGVLSVGVMTLSPQMNRNTVNKWKSNKINLKMYNIMTITWQINKQNV